MNDLEKAVCYLCTFETNNQETMVTRYKDIEAMVLGDNDLIQKYVKRYETLFKLLGN